MSESLAIGDSVLIRRDENQIPGVVTDLSENQVQVRMAESYVDETGQPDEEVWYPQQYVEKLLDDADARPELPG